MMRAYIGLGSNLEQPEQQVLSARHDIAAFAKEVGFSSLYRSPPMAGMDQPDYINAVMAIDTDLSPLDLLHALQSVENQHGRMRLERWGARTLDLDLLLYGNENINLPDLIVPHIGITERAFVLYPLFEISPELEIPQHGTLSELVARCPLAGLEKLVS
ncbi:2-amino-4-hydroxy-6-hydroxymethyldihydropteridinediphosphokinase [Patescibacteria group bacterium]|nr:2-amino-4-hydroxy-6-hydroxymethyldihydropteridinediphosphokinase [Patescibacteria group bacterium]